MTDSDNVELKKRSRRRLVGAAALALLAAIVLPMVMDQEPGSTAQDIQVTIPDREADSALSRPIASPPSREADAPPMPPEDQISAPVPPDAPRADGAGNAAESQVPAAAPAPSRVPQEPAAQEKPKVAPPAAARDAASDAARAQAILEGKGAPVSPAAGESFVVQIGAFGDGAKAASIATDLKKRGFAVYTEKVGAMTRVRVGPFRARDDAEKAAQRVRASGMNGAVMPR